jgi:FtsP/CotA-like multicopper oxidase with cupredoxin domain
MSAGPSRRQLLQGAAGAAVVAGATSVAVGTLDHPGAAAVASTPGVLDLYINDGFVPMVDGSLVYMRGFGDTATDIDSPTPSLRARPHAFLADGTVVSSRSFPVEAAHPEAGRPEQAAAHPTLVGQSLLYRAHWASYFPDRTIIAETGSTIRIQVHNRLSQDHELEIRDVARTGTIAPGATGTLSFPAPAPGTYLFSDPGGGSVERLLGLHGVLVVVPADQPWRLSPNGPEFERQWVWLCQDVDPVWGSRAHAGETIDPRKTPAVPRYFMLNDRSGYLSLGASDNEEVNRATHEETLVSGFARPTDVRDFSKPDGYGGVSTGQLIRLVNAGVVVHQMHFHGNHVWTVRRNGVDFPRSAGHVDDKGHVVLQQWEDVVELDPLDRKEIVLPIKRPPDAIDPVWEARAEDWHYPMHCHAEPSQTAAGGLYPGGLVADWVLAAPRNERTEQ